MNQLVSELRQHKQWVCYRADKAPLSPRTGNLASVTSPSDWGTYEEATDAAARNGVGIGFVLTKADDYVCIDLDTHKVTDPNTLAWHGEIVTTFPSYCEESPNGGRHIWVKGTIPHSVKSSQRSVEIYASERYMTVTGKAIKDIPAANCNGTLTKLWEELQPKKNAVPALVINNVQGRSDDDVCTSAANASNGELFKALYLGNWQPRYPSQSEADQSLCNIIAFYSDNQEQVARIFRNSALGARDKAKRNDYVGNLVRKAFDKKMPLAFDPTTLTVNGAARKIAVDNNIPLHMGRVKLVSAEDVQMEEIYWLWPKWIPRAMLTLLAGFPASGKSTIAFDFAATVSKGRMWPNQTLLDGPSDVLIWSGEDSKSHTIVPRLAAAGADMTRVKFIDGVEQSGGERPFDLAKDLPILEESIKSIPHLALLIVDPIIVIVEGDANQANIVRRSLQALVDLAERYNIAVLGITHFKKDSGGKRLADRILSSQAWVAVARMVLAVIVNESTQEKVIVRAKTNIAPMDGGINYQIEPIGLPGKNIHTTCIRWTGEEVGSPQEIADRYEQRSDNKEYVSKVTLAEDFLKKALAAGPVASRKMEQLVRDSEHSPNAITRAKNKLNIQHKKVGIAEGYWQWSLPEHLLTRDDMG